MGERKQPKWMEPLSKPELMPEDLRSNAGMTADEKMEVWRKRLYAKAVQNATRAAEHAIAARKRKDEDHAKYVLAGVVLKHMGEKPDFKTGVENLLRAGVKSDEQFLFPALFPEATRPERGPKKPKTKAEGANA